MKLPWSTSFWHSHKFISLALDNAASQARFRFEESAKAELSQNSAGSISDEAIARRVKRDGQFWPVNFPKWRICSRFCRQICKSPDLAADCDMMRGLPVRHFCLSRSHLELKHANAPMNSFSRWGKLNDVNVSKISNFPWQQVEKLLLEASDAPEEVSYKNQLSALPGIQAPFAECRIEFHHISVWLCIIYKYTDMIQYIIRWLWCVGAFGPDILSHELQAGKFCVWFAWDISATWLPWIAFHQHILQAWRRRLKQVVQILQHLYIYSLFAPGGRCNSSSRNRMDCFLNGVCEWWEDQNELLYESFQIVSIPWSKVATKATTCCIFRSFGGQRTLSNCPCRLVQLVWVYERSFWT